MNETEKKIKRFKEMKAKMIEARDIIGHGRAVIAHARAHFDGSDQMLKEKQLWDGNKTKAQEYIRRNGKKFIDLKYELVALGVNTEEL